ncbi:OLC1v1013358C1 [Oldenlandia corymbosa var. corymbosa]|uniref:OLC1v1013358C1 n=1 Tax=Oldenlandia corymbosa var. corymbosa TaxID=529605 RepID=A0AAV1E1Q6_OLDCO|nr:OLC1v1013358C1 [Oldenlandia corymbosa var. corymbosa]
MATMAGVTSPAAPPPPRTFSSFSQKPPGIEMNKDSLIKQVKFMNGTPTLEYKDDEFERLVAPHKLYLEGKFSYGRPKMEEIHDEFKKIGFNGGYTLGLMNPRHVFIRFNQEEDYQRCWIRTFWNIGVESRPVVLKRPEEGTLASRNNESHTPVEETLDVSDSHNAPLQLENETQSEVAHLAKLSETKNLSNQFAVLQDVEDGKLDLVHDLSDTENVFTEGIGAALSVDPIADALQNISSSPVPGKFPDDSYDAKSQHDGEDDAPEDFCWSESEKDGSHQHPNTPWMVGGNFNVIRSLDEYSGISVQDQAAMAHFNDFIEEASLTELLTIREEFTWCGTRSTGWVSKKLDRILFSMESLASFPQSCAMLLQFDTTLEVQPRSFCFQNMWLRRDDFMGLESVKRCLGMQKGSFPFVYLDRRLYQGRKKAATFQFILDAIDKRLSNWKNKFLSQGGHLVLIKHVLSAIALHVFAAIEPPKSIIKAVAQRCQTFLLEGVEGDGRRHWWSWNRLTFPVVENGVGLRDFHDVLKAFSFKVWWKMKHSEGIWSRFILSLSHSARRKTSWSHFAKVDIVATNHSKVLTAIGIIKKEPSFIFWETWKARNKFLFEGIDTNEHFIINAEGEHLHKMLLVDVLPTRNNEERVFLQERFLKAKFRVKGMKIAAVAWRQREHLVLNTDGSSKAFSSGYGFVIRGRNGSFHYGGSGFLGEGDCFQAEVYGLLFGVRKCECLELSPLEIQTDSQVLANLLSSGGPYPWRFCEGLEEIHAIMERREYTIHHIFREANAVVDSLAKRASSEFFEQYEGFGYLPSFTRGLILLDQQSIPYVRVRY